MSDHDTFPPEVDDEIRARLQAFAQDVAEHADTETALGRMPRRSRRPTIRVVAIAACLLAVVALAVVLSSRQAFDNTDPSQSPTQTTDCSTTTQPRAINSGGPMKTRFATPVASAATAIMLLGGCSDDGPTTLARGEDIELEGDYNLAGETLNITAEEEDGEVTGEFRVGENVTTLECADTDTDGVVILGGEVTFDSDPPMTLTPRMAPAISARATLLALIIREGDPDSVALVTNDDNAGSCTELLESIPKDQLTDVGEVAVVEDGYDIETG